MATHSCGFLGRLIEFSGRVCPLTPLENHLRTLSEHNGYDHGFIHRYFLKIIYPDDLTRQTQIFLGLGLLIFNLFVYTAYFKKRKV